MTLLVTATAFVLISIAELANGYGVISQQYHVHDLHGGYSYGYVDPNSQKHEEGSANGLTKGSYSYVDANGHIQSVSYTADPHNGFRAHGTNFPKDPGHSASSYAQHKLPLAHLTVTPLGVPAETPKVVAANAAHLSAHVAAARNEHYLYRRSIWEAAPLIQNGIPVDTPEVQHAKLAHFAAHSRALAGIQAGVVLDTPEVLSAKAAHFSAHAEVNRHPLSYHIPVIHNGVLVDTPEVQHAKVKAAAHYTALADVNHGSYGRAYPQYGPIHIPVIRNGVPVETPEVQIAKAALQGFGSSKHQLVLCPCEYL